VGDHDFRAGNEGGEEGALVARVGKGRHDALVGKFQRGGVDGSAQEMAVFGAAGGGQRGRLLVVVEEKRGVQRADGGQRDQTQRAG